AFVVATLRRAGERSLAGGAPDAAAAYLRRALVEPAAPRDRPGLLGELGIAELHIDERAAIEHLREALESTETIEERAERALAYGQALFYAGRQRDVVDLFGRTLEELGPRRPDLRGLLEGELSVAAWCEPDLAA